MKSKLYAIEARDGKEKLIEWKFCGKLRKRVIVAQNVCESPFYLNI
jgi:hypothetical protein